MAAIETTRTITGGLYLAGLFNRIFAAVAAWNDNRVTRNALAKLTDRELEDIGLARSDIERIGE